MSRGFFITRAASNSEDPTALEFWPPKGSDELHEALKQAFPLETNLAARMRQAVIEFLLQEQQDEQDASISPEYLPSPQSSFVSTMPSPAMPFTHMTTETSHPRRQSTTGQPSQQELTHVWSLESKPQAKIHTRRTMTAEEKKAYKQKRLIGACADCKKRRRKCEHNTSSSSTSPAPRKAGKSKKRATAHTPSSKMEFSPMPPVPDFSMWADTNFTFDTDMDSMAMPAGFDTEMASFELESSGFEIGPELHKDWELFPDFSNNAFNTSPTSSWPSDFVMFDTPLTVSTSNTSSANGGHALMDNSHIPGTPLSLSPMSRSQSSDSAQYNVPDHLMHGPSPAPNRPSDFAIFDTLLSSPTNTTSSANAGRTSLISYAPVTPTPLSAMSHSEFLDRPEHKLPDHVIHGICEPCTERGQSYEGRRPDCDLCFKALASTQSGVVNLKIQTASESKTRALISTNTLSIPTADHSQDSSHRRILTSTPKTTVVTPTGSFSVKEISQSEGPSRHMTRTPSGAKTTVLIPTGAFSVPATQVHSALNTERLVYSEVSLAELGNGSHGLQQWQTSSPSDWSAAQAPIAVLMLAAHYAFAPSSSASSVATTLLIGSVISQLLISSLCLGGTSTFDNVKTKIQLTSLFLAIMAWITPKASILTTFTFPIWKASSNMTDSLSPKTITLEGRQSEALPSATSSPSSQQVARRERRSMRNFIQGLQCWVDSWLRSTRTSQGKIW